MTSVNKSNWVSTTLNLSRRMVKRRCASSGVAASLSGLLQPAQEVVQQAAQLAAPDDQVAVDRDCAAGSSAAAGSIDSCSANGLTIASRADEGARLVQQHRSCVGIEWPSVAHAPCRTILLPRRYQTPL